MFAVSFPESGVRANRVYRPDDSNISLKSLEDVKEICFKLWNAELIDREFVICTDGKFGLSQVLNVQTLLESEEPIVFILQLSSKYDVIYETQRFFPMFGWCAKLLPTDAGFIWSNGKGIERKKEILPPNGWKFIEDWKVEPVESIDNVEVDQDGWVYALDLVWEYHVVKKKTDYVRRRKWIRHRELINTVCPSCQKRI